VLLARASDGAEGIHGGLEAQEARVAFEDRLKAKILNILEGSVGAGRVLVEVNADLDFDVENRTVETFDPDSQVARSTHAIDEEMTRSESEPETPTTVANNLPTEQTGAVAGPTSNENTTRTEETQNFEISRTITNQVRNGPEVNRLTIAVQVDGVPVTAADGTTTIVPRPAEELAQLASLVRTAAGVDEERGDVVEIVSRPFATAEPPVEGSSSTSWLTNLDFGKTLELLAMLGLGAAIVAFGLRPLAREVRRATAIGVEKRQALPPPDEDAIAMGEAFDPEAGEEGEEAIRNELVPDGQGQAGIPSTARPETIALRQIDGNVRINLLEEISQIIENNPEDAIRVLRSWINAQ
jgi:flagellar M-ring protein FliF